MLGSLGHVAVAIVICFVLSWIESDAVDQSMSRRKCTFLVLLVSMELALYRGGV